MAKNHPDAHVTVKHTKTGGVWDCPTGYLEAAEALGWNPVDTDETPDTSVIDGVQQTGFDPGQHNVDEVNTHLASHQDSPGEVERVLELERAGTNRSTVNGTTPTTGD